ncbi:hypothetical protein [Actinoplanes sp. NPDC051494]
MTTATLTAANRHDVAATTGRYSMTTATLTAANRHSVAAIVAGAA